MRHLLFTNAYQFVKRTLPGKLKRGCGAILAVAVCSTPGLVSAACEGNRQASTPSSRFVLKGGHAYDKRTTLTWRRCSVGTSMLGSRCVGTARLMTLDEAKRYAIQQGNGWRVPTFEELQSILERQCRTPAINSRVFPTVGELFEGSAKYWSVSPVKELPPLFYNVDFMEGGIDGNTRGIALGVRLVRSTRN